METYLAGISLQTNTQMDSKDILRSDLLDILFEHRNKDYGAYELRKHYSRRMWIAVSMMFAFAAIVFSFLAFRKIPEPRYRIITHSDPRILLTEDPFLPAPPPPVVHTPAATSSSVQERISTSRIFIRPDEAALNRLASQEDLRTAMPSDRNHGTLPLSNIPIQPALARPAVRVTASPSEPDQPFVPDEIEAGFPGGPEALRQFMSSNLVTPDELQAGEKKTVHIRFTIGADGRVSEFRIVQSAWYEYDQEVLRICRKMPKWKPARQNGVYVSASFMLPVSFVGLE